ncbi:MAG: hypothetical protein VYC03_08270, partial [Pseudomonadota bacterium]|nr:hypothetical protein [Pseudomonadota bacterium]
GTANGLFVVLEIIAPRTSARSSDYAVRRTCLRPVVYGASDLAALEAARASCLACKQTKMAAPRASRATARAHASIDTTRGLTAASRFD